MMGPIPMTRKARGGNSKSGELQESSHPTKMVATLVSLLTTKATKFSEPSKNVFKER